MRSEEEIRNMYNTLLDVQRGFTEYNKRTGNLEVNESESSKIFRQALWWVLNEDF